MGNFNSIPGQTIATGSEAYDLLTNGLMSYVFKKTDSSVNPNGINTSAYAPLTSCEMTKLDKTNLTTAEQKKIALSTILCNLLLNMAIGFILAYVLEKAKKMIKKYIAKRAEEKLARKLQKSKETYSVTYGDKLVKKIAKAEKQAALYIPVMAVLNAESNSVVNKINLV